MTEVFGEEKVSDYCLHESVGVRAFESNIGQFTVHRGLISCNLVDKMTADAAARLIIEVSNVESGSPVIFISN